MRNLFWEDAADAFDTVATTAVSACDPALTLIAILYEVVKFKQHFIK